MPSLPLIPPSPFSKRRGKGNLSFFTKGPADVPISPDPAARIGPTGNIGASGPTTDKRGHRRCFQDGMPVACLETKDIGEGVAVKEKEKKPKPVEPEPAPEPQQRQQQPQRQRVPTDRLARETLRNVSDGNYSDQDRRQVSELAERVGEEGHRQAANRLQHATTHRDPDTAAGQAERGTRRYLRDVGQIRDDPNASAPVGERGTAPQEQVRKPAQEEIQSRRRQTQFSPRAGGIVKPEGNEPVLEEGVEVAKPRRDRERETPPNVREEFQIDEPEPEDPNKFEVREKLEQEEEERQERIWNRQNDITDEEEIVFGAEEYQQAANDFGFDDPDEAATVGIETPKTFEFLSNVGIENKETFDSIGGGSALDGAQTILHEVTDESADISIKHKYIKTCDRSIRVDDDGNRYIVNEYFRLNKNAPSGTGLRVFEDQVNTAIQNGFIHIETNAAGSYNQRHEWNGYYTWVRFGYDQEIDSLRGELYQRIKEEWPDAETVQDIMEEEGGAEWWLKYGGALSNAVFDLSEGSRSRYILEEYIAEKKKKGEYLEGLVKSYFTKAMSENNGVDPISMEEANDPIFDKIGQSLREGKKQPGVPFQGPSGRWFVVRPEDNKVVPAADPSNQPAAEEQTQADPQFEQEWNQVAEQAINEIEDNDVADYIYSAQEVAAEQDWHRQLIEWRGQGGEPQPQEAANISRAVSGLVNPQMGGSYIDNLVREFSIPNQKDDITQSLLSELDRINPGGKANAIIASLVGWLFGSPAVAVVSKMPAKGKTKQPKAAKPKNRTPHGEEESDTDEPTKTELAGATDELPQPPEAIQQRIEQNPEYKEQWEYEQKKRMVNRKRAMLKQQRLDQLTPEERVERARMAMEKIKERQGRQEKRSLQSWRGMLRRGDVTPEEVLEDEQLLQRFPDLKGVAERKLKGKKKSIGSLQEDSDFETLVGHHSAGRASSPEANQLRSNLGQRHGYNTDGIYAHADSEASNRIKPKQPRRMVRMSSTYMKPKSLDYESKGAGQPCKRGETARATDCIPRSKIGSGKKPSSPKIKPSKRAKQPVEEQVSKAKQAIESADPEAVNRLIGEVQASVGKKGIAVSGLKKIAKQLGLTGTSKLKKAGLVLSIMDKLKVSRPANDLQRRLDTIKRAEKGYGVSFQDRLISAAIGSPSQSLLTPEEKEAYRTVDTSKPEGRSLVKALRQNVLERILDASEPIAQSLLDGLGVEGYGWLKADEVVPYLRGELKPHDPTKPKEGEVLPDELRIMEVRPSRKKEVSKKGKQDYLDRLLKEPVEDRIDYVKRAETGEGIPFLDRLVSGFIFNTKTGATLDVDSRIKYADLVKRTCAGCPTPRYDDGEKSFVREFREQVKKSALSKDNQENTAIVLEQLSDQGYGSLKVSELRML